LYSNISHFGEAPSLLQRLHTASDGSGHALLRRRRALLLRARQLGSHPISTVGTVEQWVAPYAERLFDYPKVDPLDRKAVQEAIEGPVEKAKAYVDRQAIDHISNITQGYPYFVQQWAHDAWNCAKGSNIDLRAAQNADSAARKNLDEGFFSVRFDRLTAGEKSYLRAMAYFGAEAVKTSKIASALGLSVQSANSVRASLVSKGMIYSPTYGDVGFTVPLFDQYMRRKIKDFTAKG